MVAGFIFVAFTTWVVNFEFFGAKYTFASSMKIFPALFVVLSFIFIVEYIMALIYMILLGVESSYAD